MARVNLGELRPTMRGAHSIGDVAPNERLEVTVLLRHNNQAALDALTDKITSGDRSQKPLTREQFTRMFSATNADRALVKQFASDYQLTVVSEDATRSTVQLSGTCEQFERAFGTQLRHFAYPNGTYRGLTEAATIPAALAGVVEGVMGLDNRPVAQTRHVVNHAVKDPMIETRVGPRAKRASTTYFAPNEFAQLYNFPEGDGTGQCVAIIELGGGYRPSDMDAYFAEIELEVPTIVPVSIDHAMNSPGVSADGADGEVALDIQVIGALAQGAKQAVYFAPNTDQGFLDAVAAATYDTINKPSVISISWGAPEVLWTNTAMQAMNRVFQAATALGVTIFAASGDNGSTDGLTDGRQHADFPSSSPYVAACGGTTVLTVGGDMISSESVWNNQATIGGASGGGISTVFELPSWQQGLKVTLTSGAAEPLTMRGTPDLTGNADPNTGYLVLVDGALDVIGGTSAVAPLMAALVARINAVNKKPSGYIHPTMYKGTGSFVNIGEGNNGYYAASKSGWNAATGLGRPDGKKLQALLAQ
jgi:kumamolisin